MLVGGEDLVCVQSFCERNESGVGQIHWLIAVFGH
jgi:hypothetical protein